MPNFLDDLYLQTTSVLNSSQVVTTEAAATPENTPSIDEQFPINDCFWVSRLDAILKEYKLVNVYFLISDFLGRPSLPFRGFLLADIIDGDNKIRMARTNIPDNIVCKDVWLPRSGILRVTIVPRLEEANRGAPTLAQQVYYVISGESLNCSITQGSTTIEITAISKTEAAKKAGVKGTAGINFEIFEIGSEFDAEESEVEGNQIEKRFQVKIASNTLSISVSRTLQFEN